MKIRVAGAGAGKTSNMAEIVIGSYGTINDNQNIYCLAFTNNAVEHIRKKLILHYGKLPNNIIVTTIHSFLYQELIHPYFYLLYGKHYKSISSIPMPFDGRQKAIKIKYLDNRKILHVEAIPQKGMWVTFKKSNDAKQEKKNRAVILRVFSSYCAKIFIDEAQDITKEMEHIITSFSDYGIDISLFGDPKQDLRGRGCFRELINNNSDSVTYINSCYRCPKLHLQLANSIVGAKEKQVSELNDGSIVLKFESDISIREILNEAYDLRYIYHKNSRVETHLEDLKDVRFENLRNELLIVLNDLNENEFENTINSYNYAHKMLYLIDKGMREQEVMKILANNIGRMSRSDYRNIIMQLKHREGQERFLPVVHSIESIKGLEGENCLFILTSDLAPYLFKEKTDDNKVKNALYVALTRSLRDLTIFITTEVEEKYSKEKIKRFFQKMRDNYMGELT